MAQRIRVLGVVSLLWITLLALIGIILAALIGQSFGALEEQHTRRDVERAANAIDAVIAAINRVTLDYAAWDDSYAFVAGTLPSYSETALSDAAFINNRFSLVMVVNTERRVVFAKAFDLSTGRPIPVPKVLSDLAPPSDRLLQLPTLDHSVSGILMLPQGPMLVAARPIMTSAYTGPARGTLIIGRMLDDQELARVGAITHLRLSINRIENGTPTPISEALRGAIAPEQPIVVRPVSDDELVGAMVLNDLAGRPSFLLQVMRERDIYKTSQAVIRAAALALLAIGVIFGASGQLFLSRAIARQLPVRATPSSVSVHGSESGLNELQEQDAPSVPAPTTRVPSPNGVIVCGELRIDPNRHTVFWGEQPVRLTRTEFRILALLAEDVDRVHTYRAIVAVSHGMTIDDLQARELVRSHMRNLRRKLPDGAILSVHGVGYRLVC